MWNFLRLIDYFIVLPLFSFFPVPLAYRFARWRGRVRAWWNPDRVALASMYAKQLLGEQGAPQAQRWLEIISCDELDAYLSVVKPFGWIRKYIHVEGEHYLQEVRQQGKGAILVSAHLGGGFFIFPFLHELQLTPQIIMRPLVKEEFVGAFPSYLSLRFRGWCVIRALRVYPLLSGQGTEEAVDAVRRGAFLWIALDVPSHLTGKTKSAEFFGHPARFPYGAFIIAARAGVPILPFFSTVDRNNHRTFRFLPPMWLTTVPHDTEAAFHRCVSLLEQEIRAQPEQWFYWDIAGVFFEPALPERES